MAKHSYPDMSVAPKFDTVVIFTPTESMHTIELLCGGSFILEMKAEPKEPGRHRFNETVPDSVATIYITALVENLNGPAFECVREWTDDGMAIGFEYLPVRAAEPEYWSMTCDGQCCK